MNNILIKLKSSRLEPNKKRLSGDVSVSLDCSSLSAGYRYWTDHVSEIFYWFCKSSEIWPSTLPFIDWSFTQLSLRHKPPITTSQLIYILMWCNDVMSALRLHFWYLKNRMHDSQTFSLRKRKKRRLNSCLKAELQTRLSLLICQYLICFCCRQIFFIIFSTKCAQLKFMVIYQTETHIKKRWLRIVWIVKRNTVRKLSET